jgi:hypothetical protein
MELSFGMAPVRRAAVRENASIVKVAVNANIVMAQAKWFARNATGVEKLLVRVIN